MMQVFEDGQKMYMVLELVPGGHGLHGLGQIPQGLGRPPVRHHAEPVLALELEHVPDDFENVGNRGVEHRSTPYNPRPRNSIHQKGGS